MPSNNTITSSMLTDFAPATKAKSAEVDQNFSIWRGHNLPVDPNTSAAAATNTYDLGASDHYWRTGYMGTLDLKGATTTTNVTFVPRQNTAGGMDVKLGGTTLASFAPGVGILSSFNPTYGSAFSGTVTSVGTWSDYAGSTVTVVTSGNPVLVVLLPAYTTATSATMGYAEVGTSTKSSLQNYRSFFRFVNSTTTSFSPGYMFDGEMGPTTSSQGFARYPAQIMWYIDSPAAGTQNYWLQGSGENAGEYTAVKNCKIMVAEIRL